VSWPKALDSTTDSFGEWSSGPVNYRIYYGPGSVPDWEHATVVKIAGNGNPAYVRAIAAVDTSQPYWFAVRASDRAEFPNEDQNSHVIVGWPAQVTEIYSGLPKAGPAVLNPLHVYPEPRLAYDAAHANVRLCVESYTATQRWMSVYTADASGFSHEADYDFADVAQNPHYKLQALALDSALRLKLLYTRSRVFGGDHILEEFHAAGSTTSEFVVTSGPDLLSAEYGPDGALHAYWLGLTDPDLEHLQFTTYYSGLPFNTLQPVHATGAAPDDYVLTVETYPWVWLANGTAATLGLMESLSTGHTYQTAPTIAADGAFRLAPLHFPTLSSGMTNYRLAGRGMERTILTDWGEDYDGVKQAQLRSYGNTLSFADEPGFTQRYLAHPSEGPPMVVQDWNNYVVSRTLSTTFQLGAAGTERIYHCLHCCWDGRSVIIPLPGVDDDEHVFPLGLLPGGLVLCRIDAGAVQRALLVDLTPEAGPTL
jgi:hypothetical protein